jgi:hypothetical protein
VEQPCLEPIFHIFYSVFDALKRFPRLVKNILSISNHNIIKQWEDYRPRASRNLPPKYQSWQLPLFSRKFAWFFMRSFCARHSQLFNGPIKYMGAGESTYPGACLTCGGDVISRNSGKDGVCVNCGPVAFDVVQRKGQQVEGFSANAWRQIQENIAEVKVRRSKDLEAAVVLGDDLQFESFRAEGLWWQSGRISWDGFTNIAASGATLIECSSYGPCGLDQRFFKTDVNFANILLGVQLT